MPVRRRSPNHIPAEDPKQGIVTILADAAAKSGSIRRTLSADMSSKKWLQDNGFFSPIKKIVSSHQIADHQNSDDDDSSDDELFKLKADQSHNQDEVWRSIQLEKMRIQKNGKLDQSPGVWGLILTQKSDSSLLQIANQTLAPAPYIHPLVKRSRSGLGLSEKSLEVCTESLGSETGSDCFSCPSDDDDEEVQSQNQSQSKQGQEMHMDLDHFPKYKESAAAGRPFPPPLPSIGSAALHMHSRREDGRLVVEAVAVAPRKYFHARRHDGRLLLTLNRPPPESESESEHENEKEHNKTGSESESSTTAVEENPMHRNITKMRLGAKKLMAVGNINPKWANEEAAVALPPRPPAARASPPAFNAYEYFWRSKPGFMMSNKNSKMNQDLVMYMRGCKEARRSLIWEPYCIATS